MAIKDQKPRRENVALPPSKSLALGAPPRDGDHNYLPPRRSRLAFFVVGLIGLAALIITILNIGDISAFADQLVNAKPEWLVLAVFSQCAAFLCTSLSWRMVLRRLGESITLWALFPLSVAKLFADQAIPSGGLSGAAFLMHALKRRGVSWDHAFSAFIFGSTTFITAFTLSAFASFVAVAGAETAPAILSIAAKAFYVLIIAGFLAFVVFFTFQKTKLALWLSRNSRVANFIELANSAATRIASEKQLFFNVTLVQVLQRMFDAITLWLAFMAIDSGAPLIACFVGASIASVTATVAPTPMGIGTFEGGLIATLAVFGISLETALTAALLFRGLSLWLPMVPGFYVVQRELLGLQKQPSPLSLE